MAFVLFFHVSTQSHVPHSKHVPPGRCWAGCGIFRNRQGTVAAWDSSLVGEKTLPTCETSYRETWTMCSERMRYWCLKGKMIKWPLHEPGETMPQEQQPWIQVTDQLHFSNWSVFILVSSLNSTLLLNDALQKHKKEKDWDKSRAMKNCFFWKLLF